jgi:hypothetical protein
MVKLSRPLRSRQARRRLYPDASVLIEGGLVSRRNLSYTIRTRTEPTSDARCPLLGNTRVISQTALDHFRTALSEHKADPYSVLLRRNKLPMGLLEDERPSRLQTHLDPRRSGNGPVSAWVVSRS